jgi:hypothetical protein
MTPYEYITQSKKNPTAYIFMSSGRFKSSCGSYFITRTVRVSTEKTITISQSVYNKLNLFFICIYVKS